MQGRKNQVPGQGGLNGDLGSLQVTDLAQQDDIGILTDNSPEPSCKGQTDLAVDLHLADTGDLVFYGVLNSDDINPGLVQDGQG